MSHAFTTIMGGAFCAAVTVHPAFALVSVGAGIFAAIAEYGWPNV